MIKIDVQVNAARINRILNAVPVAVQSAVFEKGLPAAAKVVEDRASSIAPRGTATGTTAKQSKKAKSTWGVAPLANSISHKVIKADQRFSYALVGPQRPTAKQNSGGNKANFVSPIKTNTRRVKLWGNDPRTGPATKIKDNRFMEIAAHETQQQQQRAFLRAMIAAARKELARMQGG